MNTREKMARAMADQLHPGTDNFPAPAWASQVVDRILDAMREPTEGVIKELGKRVLPDERRNGRQTS